MRLVPSVESAIDFFQASRADVYKYDETDFVATRVSSFHNEAGSVSYFYNEKGLWFMRVTSESEDPAYRGVLGAKISGVRGNPTLFTLCEEAEASIGQLLLNDTVRYVERCSSLSVQTVSGVSVEYEEEEVRVSLCSGFKELVTAVRDYRPGEFARLFGYDKEKGETA